jgi:hypothetical protein
MGEAYLANRPPYLVGEEDGGGGEHRSERKGGGGANGTLFGPSPLRTGGRR